jgi:hypothetical protein
VGADGAADRTGPDNRQLHLELLLLSLPAPKFSRLREDP